MPKSYRLKTKIGVDQSIRVNVEQDFDFLEVLSLKLRQEDVYTRFCADYGVVVGRVVANGGYGIPNANVSVFVPVDEIDLEDPVISALYPYQSPEEKNEDGFRYNLLPYVQEYGGHTPTGTFPTRQDVITRQEVLEIYEKYYKYTVKTNESGDFMIVGVPLGIQKVVLDMDLSNMGCFSLRPQDLIRMGRGTQDQFNGTQFKSSSDLASLPQIVNQIKDVDVASFWGQEDLCNIGITRVDFDLRDLGIEIEPTAVFMGSIFSTPDNQMLKKNCKPKTEQGDLCGLVTGPGEVLAIRQTIDVDSNGDPVLEQYFLPNGGKVIDGDGTFVTEVPMNLDYVYTNEFGEEVISNDPTLGIPTKSKYRFKVKYQSEQNGPPIIDSVFNPVKGEIIRANFLVPQIREYGWGGSVANPGADPSTLDGTTTVSLVFNDPNQVETISVTVPSNASVEVGTSPDAEKIEAYVNGQLRTEQWIDFPNGGTLDIKVTKRNNLGVFSPVTLDYTLYDYRYSQYQKSYAFSLDWNEYADKTAAINGEDFFYEMVYNKVYTTAQLIEEYRKGFGRARFLGIKEILDRGCESDTNKFPTNDGVRNFDFFFFIFNLLIGLLTPAFVSLIVVAHVICFLWPVLRWLISFVVTVILSIIIILCYVVKGLTLGLAKFDCPKWQFIQMSRTCPLSAIGLPNLSYPDCQQCECEEKPAGQHEVPAIEENSSALVNSTDYLFFEQLIAVDGQDEIRGTWMNKYQYGFQVAMSGFDDGNEQPWSKAPAIDDNNNPLTKRETWSFDLPLSEKLNLFNAKAKYHTDGAQNRIQVKVNQNSNPGKSHQDNVLMMVVDGGYENLFESGRIVTFANPEISKDPNLSGVTTGSTIFTTTNQTINVQYMDPSNPSNNLTTSYVITGDSNNTTVNYNFPMDVEYFQTISAVTLNEFITLANTNPIMSYGNSGAYDLLQRYIFGWQKVEKSAGYEPNGYPDYSTSGAFDNGKFQTNVPNIMLNSGWNDLLVVFLVRGVDPHSPRVDIEYDLSRLFSYSYGQIKVRGNFKLNVPIQKYGGSNDFRITRHNSLSSNGDIDPITNQRLYYPSYTFNIGTNYQSGWKSKQYLDYSAYDTTTPGPHNKNSQTTVNGAVAAGTSGSWDAMVNGSGYDYNYNNSEIVEGVGLMFAIDNSGGVINQKLSDYSYASPVYYNTNPNLELTFNDPTRPIMRSDRLPTSDVHDRRFVLHQNRRFAIYILSDEGQTEGFVSGSDAFYDGSQDFLEDGGTIASQVLNTFSCDNMVPLACYSGDGENIGVYPDGNECYYVDQDDDIKKMYGGCYYLVTKNFAIVDDFRTFAEWKSRFRMMFALCRNVVSLTFVNNWVNGTLFMYSFQKDDIYGNDPNETKFLTTPDYQFCEDTVIYQEINNSFFYRSSPYNGTQFTGKPAPRDLNGNLYGGQNLVMLGAPTTIMDMGPRDEFLQQICFNPDYQGYIVDSVKSTSYNDTSDIMQLFAISRLADANFWEQIIGLGDASIARLFSRTKSRLDGDIAQSVSINSEFGVVPFLGNNYPDDNIKYLKSDYSDPDSGPMLGIFFSGNTVDRDLITPGRVTFRDTASSAPLFNQYGFNDQEVPFHPWQVKPNVRFGKQVIFGGEENDWLYKNSAGGTNNQIDTINYQTVDRLISSYTFPSNVSTPTTEKPGFIYNSSYSGQTVVLDELTTQDVVNMKLLVGAPYHFYFGLKVGNSAMNKYIDKYLFNQEIL